MIQPTITERTPAPEGQEWRRAADFRVGDRFGMDHAAVGLPGARMTVTGVELKPKTVYLEVRGEAAGFVIRDRMRPRHDDEYLMFKR